MAALPADAPPTRTSCVPLRCDRGGDRRRAEPAAATGGAPGVTSALGGELGPPFERGRGGPGGWLRLDEPELHRQDDIVAADLAGWKRARPPLVGDEAYFERARIGCVRCFPALHWPRRRVWPKRRSKWK